MTSTDQTCHPRVQPQFPAPGWWVRDRHGDIVLVQVPNPALCVWLVCAALTQVRGLSAGSREVLSHAGEGALLAWALDEVLRGSSPVRRLVGAAVLALVLWRVLA